MFSSYSTFIGIVTITTFLCILVYCVRLKYIHRNIAPHPMQVVYVAQPPHDRLQHSQVCWSIPDEQPPPPYNAVVTTMNTNYNTVHTNNRL